MDKCDQSQLATIEFMVFSGGFLIVVGAFLSGSFPENTIFTVECMASILFNMAAIMAEEIWVMGVVLMLDYAVKTIML